MANLQIQSRAALRAALFFVLIAASHASVEAKTGLDRLWIIASNGHEIPIDIEVADDQAQKAMGLMFRTELADDKGMLFPYDEPRELSMWMHNTFIPLDMVFIRPDGVIHRIEERAEPMSDRVITSGGPVSAVLELAGGAAKRLGIKPGDRIRYPLFKGGTP
jgi:uncharacterized membrane protein (UPF0127 family)